MSEHMKKRIIKGSLVEFKLTVPRDRAEAFDKALRGLLEASGLERLTNDEGEELYEHEELFPEVSPATRLRGLRTKVGITQNELAAALGITQGRLSELENGTRPISLAMAKRIGKAYSCNYRSFL